MFILLYQKFCLFLTIKIYLYCETCIIDLNKFYQMFFYEYRGNTGNDRRKLFLSQDGIFCDTKNAEDPAQTQRSPVCSLNHCFNGAAGKYSKLPVDIFSGSPILSNKRAPRQQYRDGCKGGKPYRTNPLKYCCRPSVSK